ncbi:MAG: zf-HC2 domain-containing protein [Chloroflexota bacterium]|nr:zf-HC2 domain-containing protein [Chloroflexota bacterium]
MSEHPPVTCDSVAPYLSAYADGELAEPLRSAVAEHVGGCDDCIARVDRIRAVDALVARLPRTAPSVGAFERTLAAAHRRSSADPRTVTREPLPGASGADVRRRLREIIAPDLAPGASASEPGAPWRHIRRPWVAAAVPLVAALLLVSLAVTLFSHFSSLPRQGTASQPTPSAANPLAETQSAMGAVAWQLAFTPDAPTYLPDGASGPTVSVGPAEQVEANSRYLDITWTFASGPVRTLHLRELPVGLGFYGYQVGSAAPVALAWSLPNASGWSALTPITCASCLAVGESHVTMQLALDAQPRHGASATAVAVWLRLVSLSFDLPYQPLGVTLTPPDASLVLEYHALVSDGQGATWRWSVTTVGALANQQNATAVGNGVNITEIMNNGSSARRDNAAKVYQSLSALPSALPPNSVTQTLFAASAFVATGELWNLGKKNVLLLDGRTLSVYDLYRVNAAQPEHIYADASTGQVIAQVVDATSSAHPGGESGARAFVSTSACQPYTVTYTSIQYVPPSELPASIFSVAKPGNNWSVGTVAPAFTCQ